MATEKRLIDANEFHAYLEGIRQVYLEEDTFSSDFAATVIETVQDEYLAKFPTVDAVEVVHGRWVKTENGIHENINTGEMTMAYMHDCSVCGWHTGNQGRNFNYCPNCGAKMDSGGDG